MVGNGDGGHHDEGRRSATDSSMCCVTRVAWGVYLTALVSGRHGGRRQGGRARRTSSSPFSLLFPISFIRRAGSMSYRYSARGSGSVASVDREKHFA